MLNSDAPNDFIIYQKKIIHLAKRRGIKELDLLLGNFADYFFTTNPNQSKIKLFENILLMEDATLFKYLFTPANHTEELSENIVWQELLKFKELKHKKTT